jgi:hypothetical protein
VALPVGPLTDANGNVTMQWLQFFSQLEVGETDTITNINSGITAAAAAASAAQTSADAANAGVTQVAAGLSAEEAARLAAIDAVGGMGDGTAASNSATWSSVSVPDASWVVAVTVTVTPGGAGGDYTISAVPQAFYASAKVGSGDTFAGNWRIVEEETGGGTPVTLDSGTFTATEDEQDWEGGGGATFTDVVFTGLPSGLIAANYGVQTDIRFEMQRASGSTTLSGQAGGMSVAWTA